MESKYVRQSADSDVSFCRMAFYSDRDKREVGLPLILRLLQCCSFHWLRCSATHFRVNVWHCSLFLCSGRKRYKKKSHTIIIACEAFVTHPNWRTPGYRNIYVQNLSVQKSRLHLCAGEPTKPWIMSQECHSFMFLGPAWSKTDRNTQMTPHTAPFSRPAQKTMLSPLWKTKDPASGPFFIL